MSGVDVLRSARRRIAAFITVVLIAVLLVPGQSNAAAGVGGPSFSKEFSPDTIGPGSVSTLTFTIDNSAGGAVTDMAFVDVLPTVPGDVDIADPANVVTDCPLGIGGSLSAPDGGGTISLVGGVLGAGNTCTISVDVTASTPGLHSNTSGALSSSAGSSGTSSDDLTVSSALPGFSKSFAPSSISLGATSTLTFTIDNSANNSAVSNLDFTDDLPLGMEIADPAEASTTCGDALIPADLTADAGTSKVVLDSIGIASFPAVAAGATCTVTVDVTATGSGSLDNTSDELLADFVSAGSANASLEVTVDPLNISKSFTDDPVPPGSTVTLEFVITNFDRGFSATGVAFSDDLTTLTPTLGGLTFDSLLSNDCGGSVTGVGTTSVGLTGGTIAPEGSCTIRVSLSVPAGTTPGTYTNTTGAVSGTVGSPVTGNTATADLFVEPVPILTKEFLEVGTLAPDPVVQAGDDVVLRFTITNTSATSSATGIAFIDELTDGSGDGGPPGGFLPFPVSVTLPATPCGAGSSVTLISVGIDRQGLSLTSGSLAAAPGPKDSCSFDVTVTIPSTLAPGAYTNTTREITATVDGDTRTGDPASDDLTVVSAPQLTKSFTDDPVAPGDPVTLEFTLTHSPDAASDATDITFTDDLATLVPALAGLTANVPPAPNPPCGAGSSLSASAGDTKLTLSNGTLTPGESCTFSLTLDVPAGAAPGSYTNTTSDVDATVGGVAVTSGSASDDLDVQGLVFTKEFVGDPVIAGDTVTLRFTVDNVHPTEDATITFFTDSLTAALTGLAATGAPSLDECGGTLSGTTVLAYTGGSVQAGESCTIEVEVLVPVGTDDGTYSNTTSSMSATQGGSITIDPAVADLVIQSELLQLTKKFTDDPVLAGGTVTLEFILTNLDAGQAASGIDFTDDLDAALTDLTFDSVDFDNCGGVSGTGTTAITVAGASLASGGTCTIRVTLSVPAAAAASEYTNTTSAVTGTIGGFAVYGAAASDTLEVTTTDVQLSKSFDGPVPAGGTGVLTFTLENSDLVNPISDLGFSDDLDDVVSGMQAQGLPASPCGGSVTGTSLLAFSGGTLAAGESCSFDVAVSVPALSPIGTFGNTTSELFSNGLAVAVPATADLIVSDETDPVVTVTTPADGAVFKRNQVVLANFVCTDEVNGSGIATCVGTVGDGVPIDTSTSGPHTFTVTGTDAAGNVTVVTNAYTVLEVCNGKIVTIDMNKNGGVGIGTAFADVILGTPGPDTISAGAGNDTICAGAGNDTVLGQSGHDTIFGEDGFDTIFGQGGNDRIYGGARGDQINGGSGIDLLFGESGFDKIIGGDGNDTIRGGSGNDELFGRGGNDRIFGEAGLDKIWGEAGFDRLFGGPGDDFLNGGGQLDYMAGDDGDDTMIGEGDNDFMLGGDGKDEILGAAGADTIYGQADNDTLRGNAGHDRMFGDAGDDILIGGTGNDWLYGRVGNDTLFGRAGNDRLYGEAGADTLFGEAGDDLLSGGSGIDACNGGPGVDTISTCP